MLVKSHSLNHYAKAALRVESVCTCEGRTEKTNLKCVKL